MLRFDSISKALKKTAYCHSWQIANVEICASYHEVRDILSLFVWLHKRLVRVKNNDYGVGFLQFLSNVLVFIPK